MSAQFIVGLLRVGDPTPAADPREAARLLRFHGLEGLGVSRDRDVGGGLLPPGLVAELEPVYRRPIRNWGGEPVGELAPDLELQEIEQ